MARVVLGSRSPRRLELLRHLVSADRICVVPPLESAERGFDGLTTWPAIEKRLLEVAGRKFANVWGQICGTETQAAYATGMLPRDVAAVVCADTIIIGEDDEGRLRVLGQPPDDDSWPPVVRDWFRRYLSGRTHIAATGLYVGGETDRVRFTAVRTHVTFWQVSDADIEWYLRTGEPRGKAGGYAVQGAGSVFVRYLDGSISNVVGLPLEQVREAFAELKVDVD